MNKQDRDKNFSTYVENNPIEIYVDRNDELSEEQISSILEGNSMEVRDQIEMDYTDYMDSDDYYWTNMAEELKVDLEEIEEWRSEEGFWPGASLDDHGWRQLISNSRAYITATVEGCEYNFNNWAYGYPIEYTSPISYPNNPDGAGIGKTLKVLGINPKEFRDKLGGGSLAGPGKFKGYWPDIKNRKPVVDIEELDRNGSTLYDGVLTFCLGDLENVAEVLSGESKNITFKKGTNLVMYDFNGGAFITEATLTEDVTIPRKKLDFRNDNANHYGIQSCAGLIHEWWTAGAICAK